MRILSVKERPANIEKILDEFKLNHQSKDEWTKDGVIIMGSPNTLSGESRFTIRIKTSGILPEEEKESSQIYERLKKEYADKILSAYVV